MIEIISPFRDVEEWYDEHTMDEVEEEVNAVFKKSEIINKLLYIIPTVAVFCMVPKLSDLINGENIIGAIGYAITMFCLLLLSLFGMFNTSDTKEKLKMEKYIEKIIEEAKDE